jgi:hypothetical protein
MMPDSSTIGRLCEYVPGSIRWQANHCCIWNGHGHMQWSPLIFALRTGLRNSRRRHQPGTSVRATSDTVPLEPMSRTMSETLPAENSQTHPAGILLVYNNHNRECYRATPVLWPSNRLTNNNNNNNNNNNYTFPVRRLGVFRDDLMITR